MKQDQITVFATTLFQASIYEPVDPDLNTSNVFWMSFPAGDVPRDLRPYCKAIFKDGVMKSAVNGRQRPIVVASPTSKCSLDTTLHCARVANIPVDRLFDGITVQIAVRFDKFENRSSARRLGETVERLTPVAIQVDVDAMVENYDRLCAQYFTGD